jgi:3-phenylpropionate/cinnamic acid dioxygenase small subunit
MGEPVAQPPLDEAGEIAGITDLLHEYCELVDANRQAEVIALFTEDAEYDHGHGRLFRGRAELAELFAALDTNDATSHHLSNIRIRLTGTTTASCRSYVYAFHRRAGSGTEVHLWGRYDDLVERTSSGWRIRRRRLTAAAERGTVPDPGRSSRYQLIPRVGRNLG